MRWLTSGRGSARGGSGPRSPSRGDCTPCRSSSVDRHPQMLHTECFADGAHRGAGAAAGDAARSVGPTSPAITRNCKPSGFASEAKDPPGPAAALSLSRPLTPPALLGRCHIAIAQPRLHCASALAGAVAAITRTPTALRGSRSNARPLDRGHMQQRSTDAGSVRRPADLDPAPAQGVAPQHPSLKPPRLQARVGRVLSEPFFFLAGRDVVTPRSSGSPL